MIHKMNSTADHVQPNITDERDTGKELQYWYTTEAVRDKTTKKFLIKGSSIYMVILSSADQSNVQKTVALIRKLFKYACLYYS